MDDKPRVYIAGTGTITALGGDTNTSYHAVRADISSYRSVDYFTQQRERITMALVPDGALPPLEDDLDIRGKAPFRYRRILRMCHVAATQAMATYTGKTPIPVFFSAPANDVGLNEPLPKRIIHDLHQQTGLPIDPAASRLMGTGRSGVLNALDLAFRYLYGTDAECVLIGGGDSYQNSELLAALDKEDRILAPGVTDGFAPGESAAFVLLTRNPALALRSATHLPSLLTPGIANEPGHLFSDEPYRGDGLDQAFKSALAAYDGDINIGNIYSSMNCEHYWAKEYGVAITRNANAFDNEFEIHHPADCYGDLGAATGAVLINFVTQALLNGHITIPSLIYCSSDHQYRAAVCFEPLPLAAFQTPLAPHHASVTGNVFS